MERNLLWKKWRTLNCVLFSYTKKLSHKASYQQGSGSSEDLDISISLKQSENISNFWDSHKNQNSSDKKNCGHCKSVFFLIKLLICFFWNFFGQKGTGSRLRCLVFCQYVLPWDPWLSEQNTEQISFHVISNFCKSAPSSPPLNNALFCWKLLPSHIIPPTVSSELQSPCFSFQLCLSFFFLTGFFAVALLLLWNISLAHTYYVPELCILSCHCVVSLPVLPSTESEINQHWLPATSTGGAEMQFWKKNCGGIQISKGVSFCWINLDWEHWSNLLFSEMNGPTSR